MAENLNCKNTPVVISKDQNIPGTGYYKMWTIGSAPLYKAQVPIFNIYNMHGLNSIIGYMMLKNAHVGKVLYRGQTKLYCGDINKYNDLLPSICHIRPQNGESIKEAKEKWNKTIKLKNKSLDKDIKALLNDPDFLKQVNYNFDIDDTENLSEMQIVTESLLQHYGGSTRCMDFVDNHWIALWFGLYQWISIQADNSCSRECFYKKRILKLPRQERLDSQKQIRQQLFNELKKVANDAPIAQSQDTIQKLIKHYTYDLSTAEDEFLYILLFVANTLPEYETVQHAGVYSSPQMTVVDLRRALPSVFLRPGAQHGWTVKMKSGKRNMNRGDYSFAKNIVAILRVPLSLADELIGGALLSQENLFPPEDYDQGYHILLERQRQAIAKVDKLTATDKAFKNLSIFKYI